MSRKNFDDFCVGIVTVITANSLVLTGRLQNDNNGKDKDHDGKDKEEFVTLTLTAPVLKIPGNAGPAPEQPFYAVGDVIRINEEEIVAVGPSHILVA
jgi:hypothetical protein